MRYTPLMLAAFLVACTGKDEGEDPAEHACEHVDHAGDTVAAGTDPDSTAPQIVVSEEPVTVELVSGASGYVRVESSEDQAALLFLGTADVVTGLWYDGAEMPLPTPGPNADCSDDIPEHFDLDLEPGTWHIELGPAAVDSVWMLLIGADGHAHE